MNLQDVINDLAKVLLEGRITLNQDALTLRELKGLMDGVGEIRKFVTEAEKKKEQEKE